MHIMYFHIQQFVILYKICKSDSNNNYLINITTLECCSAVINNILKIKIN